MPAPAPTTNDYGRTLRQLRKERGMRQDDLAAAVGVTQATVSDWETGRAAPKPAHHDALEDVLGISRQLWWAARSAVATLPEASSGDDAIPGKLYQLSNHRPLTPAELTQRPEAA